MELKMFFRLGSILQKSVSLVSKIPKQVIHEPNHSERILWKSTKYITQWLIMEFLGTEALNTSKIQSF